MQPNQHQHVSIITASLNRPSLALACASVNNQTYPYWHHYVLGDGIQPYDDRSPRRTVIGFSRPLGSEEPTKDMPLGTPNPIIRWALEHLELAGLVCFLDDDNAYEPRFLEEMLHLLQGSDAGIVLCAMEDRRAQTQRGSLYRIDTDPDSPPFDGYPECGRCDNSAFLTYGRHAKEVQFPRADPGDDAIQDYLFIRAIANRYGWVRTSSRLVIYGSGDNFPPNDR